MQDLLGVLRRSKPPEDAEEADWPFPSSQSGPIAAAVKLVVVRAAGVCLVSVAVGFESGVLSEGVFDEVEELNWGLGRGSLFGWVGNGGRSWTEWRWWMETYSAMVQHHWHYQGPWSQLECRSLEHWRQTVLRGCWLGGRGALASDSAEFRQNRSSNRCRMRLTMKCWSVNFHL